jgi:hypothetical protein
LTDRAIGVTFFWRRLRPGARLWGRAEALAGLLSIVFGNAGRDDDGRAIEGTSLRRSDPRRLARGGTTAGRPSARFVRVDRCRSSCRRAPPGIPRVGERVGYLAGDGGRTGVGRGGWPTTLLQGFRKRPSGLMANKLRSLGRPMFTRRHCRWLDRARNRPSSSTQTMTNSSPLPPGGSSPRVR